MTKSFNEKLIDMLKMDSRFVDDEGELGSYGTLLDNIDMSIKS